MEEDLWVIILVTLGMFVALLLFMPLTLIMCMSYTAIRNSCVLTAIYIALNVSLFFGLLIMLMLMTQHVTHNPEWGSTHLPYQILDMINRICSRCTVYLLMIRIMDSMRQFKAVRNLYRVFIVICWALLILDSLMCVLLTWLVHPENKDDALSILIWKIFFLVSYSVMLTVIMTALISSVILWKLSMNLNLFTNQKLFSALLLTEGITQAVYIFSYIWAKPLDLFEGDSQSLLKFLKLPPIVFITLMMRQARAEEQRSENYRSSRSYN